VLRSNFREVTAMGDVLYPAVLVSFFILCALYVAALERI
jgi:hypothetical protein